MRCEFDAPSARRMSRTAAVMLVTGVPLATLSHAVETVPTPQPLLVAKKSAAKLRSFWRLSWSTRYCEAVISMSTALSWFARISSAIRYSSANCSQL